MTLEQISALAGVAESETMEFEPTNVGRGETA